MPLGFLGPIGTPELLIILLVALLLFGGRLPDVARSVGKSFNQFKKGLKEVDDEINKPEKPEPPRVKVPAALPSRIEPDAAAARPPELGSEKAGKTAEKSGADSVRTESVSHD